MSLKPKKILAPIIIAGITIGFLASAYRFVFKKTKTENSADTPDKAEQVDSKSPESKDSE